jgi:hypothetical protein
MTFVVELGIAAITSEPDTTMAATAAPTRAEVKERISHIRAKWNLRTT